MILGSREHLVKEFPSNVAVDKLDCNNITCFSFWKKFFFCKSQNSEMQNTYLLIKSSQVIYFFYIQKSITKEDSKLDLAGIQESRVVYHACICKELTVSHETGLMW